jgi:hypothetical protein
MLISKNNTPDALEITDDELDNIVKNWIDGYSDRYTLTEIKMRKSFSSYLNGIIDSKYRTINKNTSHETSAINGISRNEIVAILAKHLYDSERKIAKCAKGAIKSTIDAHGPITTDNLAHAIKRIDTQIWALIKRIIDDSIKELSQKHDNTKKDNLGRF